MVRVLSSAGVQVPVIPSLEVVGKSLSVSPSQTGSIAVNPGVITGSTTTVIVASSAHCPASVVNVYSVVNALLIAGDQFPVIPSIEVNGNANASPSHMGSN